MAAVPVAVDIRDAFTFDVGASGGSGTTVDITALVAVEVTAGVIPAPSLPPVAPVMWQRVSETYPDPNASLLAYDRPDPAAFKPTSTVRQVLGRPFVRVDGQDLTFWRGVPVRVASWSESEPWGWEAATFEWPQGTLLTAPSDLEVRRGASVDLGLADESGAFLRWLWRGICVEAERDEDRITVQAVGLLREARLAAHQPPFWPSLADSGVVIADAMNRVVSRRFGMTARVTTGIETASRGARSDTVDGFVSGLLGLMTEDNGVDQWTLMPTDDAVPVLRHKDRTTEQWTATVGARGVRATLTEDFTDPNVIYGSGVDGTARWDNARWPGSNTNTAPPYPNANPANTLRQGETDADTDNGHGITQLQTKLKSLGYTVTVSGTYDGTTRSAVRAFQANAGIQVDGVVGGQTWGALWPTTGILGTPFFQPLAADGKVMPYTYAADGTVTGTNSAYDPRTLRVERFVSFGEGVTRDRAQAWATGQIVRNQTTPNVSGTVTLTSDPQQGSRRLVRAGHNIRLRGYAGTAAGIRLHISRVEHDDTQTRLTVDARARDALELAAIVARDRAATDPALRILSDRQSTTDPDTSPWSAEAPAGIVPKRTLYGRLWSVFGVPAGRWGTIVRTAMQTAPATGFAMAVFSRPVTSSWLLSVVGDPLADGGRGWGGLTEQNDVLEQAGYLIGWGGPGAAMGYAPAQTSPSGGSGDLTGTFREDARWDFASDDSVYLWVAVYAQASTNLTGRLYVSLPLGGA